MKAQQEHSEMNKQGHFLYKQSPFAKKILDLEAKIDQAKQDCFFAGGNISSDADSSPMDSSSSHDSEEYESDDNAKTPASPVFLHVETNTTTTSTETKKSPISQKMSIQFLLN